MATLIIDENEDPVAAARAVASALTLWLASQPRPESAPPASGHCKYDEAGNLRSLNVTLGDD
ncbi:MULTISPECIES: hypothetical protein [unclassified Pseudomonas]|uniref:hypothetical protein n=1 Tax=unclassified Pseudomonas TaxID=196821 RepID=UPI003FA1A287